MNADQVFINNMQRISLISLSLMNVTGEAQRTKATGVKYWNILNQHTKSGWPQHPWERITEVPIDTLEILFTRTAWNKGLRMASWSHIGYTVSYRVLMRLAGGQQKGNWINTVGKSRMAFMERMSLNELFPCRYWIWWWTGPDNRGRDWPEWAYRRRNVWRDTKRRTHGRTRINYTWTAIIRWFGG